MMEILNLVSVYSHEEVEAVRFDFNVQLEALANWMCEAGYELLVFDPRKMDPATNRAVFLSDEEEFIVVSPRGTQKARLGSWLIKKDSEFYILHDYTLTHWYARKDLKDW